VCDRDNCAVLANAVFGGQFGLQISGLCCRNYAFTCKSTETSTVTSISRAEASIAGFHFMVNFRQPFLANRLQDFWRAAHQLEHWLRDSCNPLGEVLVANGNRPKSLHYHGSRRPLAWRKWSLSSLAIQASCCLWSVTFPGQGEVPECYSPWSLHWFFLLWAQRILTFNIPRSELRSAGRRRSLQQCNCWQDCRISPGSEYASPLDALPLLCTFVPRGPSVEASNDEYPFATSPTPFEPASLPSHLSCWHFFLGAISTPLSISNSSPRLFQRSACCSLRHSLVALEIPATNLAAIREPSDSDLPSLCSLATHGQPIYERRLRLHGQDLRTFRCARILRHRATLMRRSYLPAARRALP